MPKATFISETAITLLKRTSSEPVADHETDEAEGVPGLRKGGRCLFTSESLHAKLIDS